MEHGECAAQTSHLIHRSARPASVRRYHDQGASALVLRGSEKPCGSEKDDLQLEMPLPGR